MTAPENAEGDLGWALFVLVRRYRHLTDELLADLPGGPRGYQVLMAAAQGEPRSQLALAQYLGVDRTVMTYLLDDLESAGLVERKPDPADRRARRVELTRRGRTALSGTRRRLRSVEDALLDPLEPEQRDHLRALLHRLASTPGPGASPTEGEPPPTSRRTKRRT